MKIKKTIFISNLGCAKNIIDGERMMAQMSLSDYKFINDPQDAEVILVNTCAFIEEAKQEAIETILQMATYKNEGNCNTLVVTGCFSQRYRDKVANQLPEVDLWAGVNDWSNKLTDYFNTKTQPEHLRILSKPLATQYIKIAEGCSNYCSFCAIPLIRGSYRSRTINSVINEAKWLEKQGTKECIVVSQETTRFGWGNKESLEELLRQMIEKTSFDWIRMMYLYPDKVSDELIKLTASEPRICPYFDIPIQHASNKILKLMNRKSSIESIKRLIDKIRTIIPQASIRTTFILGFPGETEKDFKQLLDFVEWAKLDKVGVFPYSPEEDTKAYNMRPRPRNSTAIRRCETLIELQKDISCEILQNKIGKTIKVLIDSKSDVDGYKYEGRSQLEAPEIDGSIFVKAKNIKVGEFVNVKITDSDDYDLYGTVR